MKNQEMKICLWFDNQAEEAASFYTSIFSKSSIGHIARYGKEGFEYHGKQEGSVLTVEFTINGMNFVALNGGPVFKFNEAVSIMVLCDSQEEIDRYWLALTKGGEESQCGWLKDKFGVSWQIVPSDLDMLLSDKDVAKKARVEKALFQMKKLDMHKLRAAYEGVDITSEIPHR